MAPKVKSSTVSPEATHDTPSGDSAPSLPPAKAPKRKAKGRHPLVEAASTPKRKSEKKTQKEPRKSAPGTPRGRPSKETVFITAVASKCALHQDVVSSVLDAVQSAAVDSLKTTRKFAVGFFQGRLTAKPEAPAKDKMVNGKLVTCPARPATTVVKLSPSKTFRMMFQ